MHLSTVVGGTGTQGRSVIEVALKTSRDKIRATTRNPDSQNAKKLTAKGVEVVKADLNDEQSLVRAFEESTHICTITDFFEPFAAHGPEKAIEIEAAQGINLARAAAKTPTLQHFVWSTLPSGSRITNGKYNVPHLVTKNRVDDFIRRNVDLLAKTTFPWITYYGDNFQYPMFTPNLMVRISLLMSHLSPRVYRNMTADTTTENLGSYIQLSPAGPSTPIKSIGSPSANIGIFALAIFNQPAKTHGENFVAAYVEETTIGQMLQDWAEVTGKKAAYVQVSLDDFSAV